MSSASNKAPRDEDDVVNRMRRVNRRQREFYESRFAASDDAHPGIGEKAANVATNTWTFLRRHIQDARDEIGITAKRRALHVEWIDDEDPARILDLGCFDGNDLSLWMAKRADKYLGIDLSDSAIASLKRKLRHESVENADARAVDFLKAGFQKNSFDLVYAKSVLHHFEFLEPVLRKLTHILEPGGVVISTDPLRTEPINRLARALYRPFQTDSQWEWPFSRSTFSLLRRFFVLESTQGFLGASKFSFPLFLLPFGEGLGHRIGEAGHGLDEAYASRPGPYLFNMCWQVSLLMRSRDEPRGSDGETFE